MNKSKKEKKYFKYVIIAAVLIIPFMYSFFYLKAYWDPYGAGNIDNIPVAIVNEDQGDKGTQLVNNLKEKKKLKLNIVSATTATDGLYNGDYYAIISIPQDFTANMNSASTTNKHHAVVTYSPNQKSNYLASQIINNVVSAVEKNLDNSVNSAIVSELSNTVESIPDKLNTVSDGFQELKYGTSQLKSGSQTLSNGTTTLTENYDKFNDGVKTLKEGTSALEEATSQFSTISSNLDELTSGVDSIKSGSDTFTTGFNSYVTGVNTTLGYTQNLVDLINGSICPKVAASTATQQEQQMCAIAQGLSTTSPTTANTTALNYLKGSGMHLQQGNAQLNSGINELDTKVNELSGIKGKIAQLQGGINQLSVGANELYNNSLQIKSGINTLNSGANTLNSGINTLDNGILSAKSRLDSNIETTKKEVKKVDGLAKYSEEPVQVKTEEVNKVSSYGTAFSPFFISIALWVGCLMMYIVLYYDKEERFAILGINNKNRIQRTLAYHALATLAGIILGILLYFLLDFEITNIFLYFIAIILTSNAFMGITEFLIGNFKDVGKFIALILLVLQLAAAGGTFPIETVTKGFRWLHGLLPMTYTVRLLREPLVSIENNLLTPNILVVSSIFIIFFVINIIIDIYKQKHEK